MKSVAFIQTFESKTKEGLTVEALAEAIETENYAGIEAMTTDSSKWMQLKSMTGYDGSLYSETYHQQRIEDELQSDVIVKKLRRRRRMYQM